MMQTTMMLLVCMASALSRGWCAAVRAPRRPPKALGGAPRHEVLSWCHLGSCCHESFTSSWGARSGEQPDGARSEEHTSELQSLMRISYAVFCLKKNNTCKQQNPHITFLT